MKKKIWAKWKQSRGFTLLEIVVAILILTIALLGLASLTSTIINGNFFNRTLTVATTLAKDKLEELKSEPLTGTGSGATIPSAYSGTDYRCEYGNGDIDQRLLHPHLERFRDRSGDHHRFGHLA